MVWSVKFAPIAIPSSSRRVMFAHNAARKIGGAGGLRKKNSKYNEVNSIGCNIKVLKYSLDFIENIC